MTRLSRYAFVIIPALGVLEVGAHLYFAKRPPSFDDWAAAAPLVREAKQDGDVVVIAPDFADPAARRFLGDDLMPLRDVARPDVTRYAHALELSILGARSPELAGWREESRATSGKFTVRRVANPSPVTVQYDFVDHTHPPDADVRGTDPAVACKWNPAAALTSSGPFGHPVFPTERFECPGGAFFNVGVTVIGDEEFHPRRCVWSHPFARGEIVTRFHHVPLGRTIHGHGGIYWMVERERRGTPITLTVRVDGDAVGTLRHVDGDGWKGFDFDLGAHAGARDAEVEFAAASARNLDRHFCFEADTR